MWHNSYDVISAYDITKSECDQKYEEKISGKILAKKVQNLENAEQISELSKNVTRQNYLELKISLQWNSNQK